MQHYFVSKIGNTLYFKKEDEHHILHVMRLKSNDQIIGIIENEGKYLSSLVISDGNITASIIKEVKSNNELSTKVTLVYGLVKQEKFELVLQKAVELGVSEIIPFASIRSIVKIEAKDEEKKLIRWNKIAKEAAEQARRIVIPNITSIQKLDEICQLNSDIKLVAYEKDFEKGTNDLYNILTATPLDNKSICIVVGAEGGFDEKEISKFNKHGFINVSLGKRILRSETAAIYSLSIISFLSERGE